MDQGGVERGIVEMNRVLVAAGHDNLVVSVGGRLNERIIADGGRVAEIDIKSKNPFTAFSLYAFKKPLSIRRVAAVKFCVFYSVYFCVHIVSLLLEVN